jgi:hypothetical protein
MLLQDAKETATPFALNLSKPAIPWRMPNDQAQGERNCPRLPWRKPEIEP